MLCLVKPLYTIDLMLKQLLVNHESYGNIMTVLTVVVHDKTGFPTITVSSQLTNDIADGKSY